MSRSHKGMLTRRPILYGIGTTLLAGPWPFALAAPSFAGRWVGNVDTGSLRVRLAFELKGDGSGAVHSPDETCTPLPVEVKSLAPDDVKFKVAGLDASFRGTFTGSDRIEGIWTFGVLGVPLVLIRGDATAVLLPQVQPLTTQALEAQRRDVGMPALVAAAQLRGHGLKRWISGERLLGSGVAVGANDSWHLGSITKSITATLVARLVDSNALHWNDTVGDLPQKPNETCGRHSPKPGIETSCLGSCQTPIIHCWRCPRTVGWLPVSLRRSVRGFLSG